MVLYGRAVKREKQIWHTEATTIARSALWAEVHDVKPMHNLHLCHHGHFVHRPLGNDRNGQGKRVITQNRSSYLPDYWIPFFLDHLLMNIYMGHIYLHILHPFKEIYSHTSSTNVFLNNFPIMLLASPWTASQSMGWAHESLNNSTLDHFSSK